MKPISGTGKHTTIIKDMYLKLADTIIVPGAPFFLECEYEWESGCDGNSEQPEEKEYFSLTSLRTFSTIVFMDYRGIKVLFPATLNWLEVLPNSVIESVTDQVLEELKEDKDYNY